MKKIFYTNEGFKIIAKYDGNAIIDVNMYKKYLCFWFWMCGTYFYIKDYKTIEDGVDIAVKKLIIRYNFTKDIKLKLKEYFNNY